jgi:SAM-dependent methyltransferase
MKKPQEKISLHHRLFPHGINKIRKAIGDDDTVLDPGCGLNSPLQYCRHGYSLGVDVFPAYIEASRGRGIHSEYMEADITKVDFEPDSFDIVLCTQVIEHFTREDREAMLAGMYPWARKKVIVTTPNGYLPNSSCHDNDHQEHLSGWTIDDLERNGFRVSGISILMKIRTKHKPTLFWRRAFDITSRFTYAFPRSTFQLLAIRNK